MKCEAVGICSAERKVAGACEEPWTVRKLRKVVANGAVLELTVKGGCEKWRTGSVWRRM